jgi:hypothetical protein
MLARAAGDPNVSANTAQTAAASTPVIAAASASSACSPLAGAWIAKLSSPIETVVQTFKFAPINNDCSKFVVNSQASTRSAKTIKCWPDATELTEFVGTACEVTWGDLQFTAIGYGVQRCDTVDKIVFIAIMTGRVEVPQGCAPCSGKDPNDPTLNDPNELNVTIYVSYYDAEQDQDRDGFPDCECEEAVICVCYQTKLKRVELMAPCDESKSYVACLKACKDCNTPATGRTFLRMLDSDQTASFVLTVKDIKDVTRACIQVCPTAGADAADAVTLFPGPKNGDCEGLLCSGSFAAKDGTGPLKGKKMADFLKACDEGRASVLVYTKTHPKGEIGGKFECP